jgi:hypothetical protein
MSFALVFWILMLPWFIFVAGMVFIDAAAQFADWAIAHPSRMKEPDTIITDDWKNL